MNIDTIIAKRFEELINESKNIPHFRAELIGECVDTQKYVKWATSVMGYYVDDVILNV